LERDRGGKISREGLLEFVTRELRRHGKGSEPAAREMILARAGDDLRGVQQELDKLVLFVGEQATIRAADVEMIFADHGEGWIFDLTRAIGERDAPAALAHLARLLAQGEPPLRLLATIAAELRRLLKVRQLLETDCARSWKKGMSYQQFQHSILPQVGALLSRNPYGDYLCFQRAESFSLADLHACMEKVFAADLRLKSSGSETHLVMEKLLLGMCLGGSRGNAQSRAPATLR
jgi:DNA polymerase-3 subunit delta